MAEYIVKINERTKRGKLFLEFLRDYAKSNDAVSIHIEDKVSYVPNAETRRALRDADAGRTIKVKNKRDFYKKMEA
jgi:hypothetical protein